VSRSAAGFDARLCGSSRVVQVTPSVLEALWKALVVATGDRKHDPAFRATALIRIKRLHRNPGGRILRFV
jgi:hypothetical protein